MSDLYQAVVHPVITEKSSAAYAARHEYTFRCDLAASKQDIKQAIEQLFDVRVTKVRTAVQRSKRKTFGRYQGRRPRWKKAFVTLHPDDSLTEIFEG
jgi:large subunit ribosomal protein L23